MTTQMATKRQEHADIFLIYTDLQGVHASPEDGNRYRGLGYIDSTKDVLEIALELLPEDPPKEPTSTEWPSAMNVECEAPKSKQRRRRTRPTATSAQNKGPEKVEIELLQDITSLRSRKGDTGSVVWKASIDFARYVLQRHRFPSEQSLFNYERLKECHVLELGSGTGILSILLSPLVAKYTVTDIEALVPLIQKNINKNFPSDTSRPNISAEPLDWIALHSSTPAQRAKLFSNDPPVDLILVVDCIYHPSLIPPLLSTIDHVTIPDRTTVLVLSELRSEEVLREFLLSWLDIPGWKIWHVGGDLLQNKRYVMWTGWKPSTKGRES
ncbi:hypothetical protein CC1G_05752 [Coprinopsis cinerea okayama7|uniref:Uncharacterized protein n=1 Tax=Coprinopsis cinerea (strain Okayama-7 / 130 / ATCC MYA-4618 / FGSC 9003) TaxID=240176 RepID=A8NA25_COPC7|nr:hypothetical protein CC1G_05752 [Coprinopsis cinerea okayama7\|eukprot:XP_001831681.2 hypothetical protein CC1G_05752 [Coprinopsis cinerea okayama7\